MIGFTLLLFLGSILAAYLMAMLIAFEIEKLEARIAELENGCQKVKSQNGQ